MALGQRTIRRFRRLTRARKIVVALGVVIAVLTGIALIPWERFDEFHEAGVSSAHAASKGQRQLGVIAPSYDWRVSNCRERAGVDWPGHWRCDVRTVDPVCSGYVLLDVYVEDHGAADIWHVQNKVKRCAPWGMFGPLRPDSEWE